MDILFNMSNALADALIIHANHHRFQPGERLPERLVYSRMQLWCHSGRGQVTVNDQDYELHPGSVVIMPWCHRVSYRADRSQSCYVSGLHLIPHCRPAGEAPWFQTPHSAEDPLARARWFADRPIPGCDSCLALQLVHDHPLLQLGGYVLSLLSRRPIDEQSCRHATQSVLHEWQLLAAQPQAHQTLPAALERVCSHIRQYPAQQLDLSDAVRLAACSVATLHRLSHEYLDMSLLQWQRQQQIAAACELLRSTRLPVQEIADRCGFSDALYFSRVFKQQRQMSPRAWRQRYAMM